jgi:hypothetical protein
MNFLRYFYWKAGYYKPSLLYKKKTEIASVGLLNCSNGWELQLDRDTRRNLVTRRDSFVHNGVMNVSDAVLRNMNVDVTGRYSTIFRYFKPFGISNDFDFSTRMRNNSPAGSISCNDVKISIIGRNERIIIKHTMPKCSRYVEAIFDGKKYFGDQTDLSQLALDFKNYHTLRLKVVQNNLSIFYDDNEAYTRMLQNQLGEIVGISIEFYGSGEADWVKLGTPQGGVVLYDDFNK